MQVLASWGCRRSRERACAYKSEIFSGLFVLLMISTASLKMASSEPSAWFALFSLGLANHQWHSCSRILLRAGSNQNNKGMAFKCASNSLSFST
jgi:hypothetical protein